MTTRRDKREKNFTVPYGIWRMTLEARRLAIALGRQSLIDAKYQLGLALKRRIEEFEPIPEGWFRQRLLAIRYKGIFDRCDDEILELQNYYALYLESTKLLAASYVATGEIETAKKAYEDSIKFVKTIRFENVQTIRFVHESEGIQDLFVYHPVSYIEAEQKDAEENAKDFDYMIIETWKDFLY